MPVLTKINTNVIADDAVTAAKIPAGAVQASEIATGGVSGADIGYLGDGSGNLSGTITNQQLHFGSAFTLTDDLTVNDNLTLAKLRDDGTGQSITGDGKTITGTGTLTMGGSFEGGEKDRPVTGVLGSGVNLDNVTFPVGHIVQTVSQEFNENTSQTSDATVQTHIEKNITITAGNKVFFNYSIPCRMFASGYAYGQFRLYVYHKVTNGGTYANINSTKYVAQYIYDESGNLPTDFKRYFNIHISGVHTPSSGTEQYYRIYVEKIQGNDVYVGNGTDYQTFVTLQEIQS